MSCKYKIIMNIEWKISKELVSYQDAISLMEARVASIISGEAQELIWSLEHPPLYTAGTSATNGELLNKEYLPVHFTGRGGKYTYHGPGQRVVYVMLNLQLRNPDLKLFIYNLEQWIINSLKQLNIFSFRASGRVGIWVNTASGQAKIAAIGVRVRKWVTYHGIAINLNPDLNNYQAIIPCGLENYGITSIHNLGHKYIIEQLDQALMQQFEPIFNI